MKSMKIKFICDNSMTNGTCDSSECPLRNVVDYGSVQVCNLYEYKEIKTGIRIGDVIYINIKPCKDK